MVTDYTKIGGVFSIVVTNNGTVVRTCSAHNQVMTEGKRALWATATTTPVLGGKSWYCGLLDGTSIGVKDHFPTGSWVDYYDDANNSGPGSLPKAGALFVPGYVAATGLTTISQNKALVAMSWGAASAGGIQGNCTFSSLPSGTDYDPNGLGIIGILIANAANSGDDANHSLWCTAATSTLPLNTGDVVSVTYNLATSPSSL